MSDDGSIWFVLGVLVAMVLGGFLGWNIRGDDNVREACVMRCAPRVGVMDGRQCYCAERAP